MRKKGHIDHVSRTHESSAIHMFNIIYKLEAQADTYL